MKVSISLEMLHLFLRLYPDALKSTHPLSISHLRVPYVEETRELFSEEQTHGISEHLFGGLENALVLVTFPLLGQTITTKMTYKRNNFTGLMASEG